LIQTLRQAAYRHGYLLITAAWLYTLSFIFTNYWSYHSSPGKVQARLEQRLHEQEKRFTDIVADTALIHQLLLPTDQLSDPFADAGLFIYEVRAANSIPLLRYWNNNRMYISGDSWSDSASGKMVINQNGEFILLRDTIHLRGQDYIVAGLLPIRWAYFIENKYLKAGFAGSPRIEQQYIISEAEDALPVRSMEGREWFRIQQKPGKSFIAYDPVTIVLRVLFAVLLLIFLNALAVDLLHRHRFRNAFLFLLLSVFLLRCCTYLFPFPFDFSKLPLFDPAVYASNFLHPSLGDLLVNAVLLFWLIGFYKTHADGRPWWRVPFPRIWFAYGCLVALTLICFLLAGVLISLVRDSKIPFDVTNFFGLTVYSVISFVILCLLVLSFYQFYQVLSKPARQELLPLYFRILAVVLSGFVYILLFTDGPDTRVYLAVLLWLCCFLLLTHAASADVDLPLLGSGFFIFWMMIFAASIAVMVVFQNGRVEQEQRKRIAEKLAQQTDPSGENLLNIAATNFDDRFLSENFHRFHMGEFVNKFIKDSLINQNFSGYLNKYDTRIYTFDSLFHPLYNEDSASFASIKTIVLNQAKSTVIPDLFTYETLSEGFNFIYQKTVMKSGRVQGYLFVLMGSKRYKSEALYPELFTQVQDIASDLNTSYAYAVYNRGKIINHFNNYSFPSVIGRRQLTEPEFTFRQNGAYSELWYTGSNNKQVLVVKRNNTVMECVTLFAYLFCSFLLIMLLFQSGSMLISARFNWRKLREKFRFTIRTQIQATIIFLSVFSFLVIGAATISFFILRFNRNNEDRLSKSIQVMANEVNTRMNSLLAFDDVPDNSGVKAGLEKTMSEISDLHNVDINYYNPDGTLLVSTQPYIYNKHLLSSQMEPRAFRALQYGKSIRYLQSESIGSFQYLSIYVPLTDESGNQYAYLNIPYLNAENELNQEISGFLATLINLNAFIFLIAGAIAFFLTNRITASLRLIGQKMQEMNLGKINEAIEWNRDDEIGRLVEEYNKMVKKLELSAQALAQSEREGAWREMARQVAHEIKNPLTPMKLSIQYLQNAIQKGAPNVKELSENMAETLIEQIDQLSKIAGDFSQFANIGNARMEVFDISEVLASQIRLHSTNPRVSIQWHKAEGLYAVYADKVQMNRLFTNLFQNAIEASSNNEQEVHIELRQHTRDKQIVIEVEDHSGGIPADMRDHIFTPNFTTKTSGTGLGLAICKGIVENANGEIGFSSEEGQGTTFTIRLPLHV
jgi:two-component system nitrogen regulation sensor histidine kinase NtrY